MVASLDAELFRAYVRRAPALERMVKDARRLKESVCAQDPYEQQGLRRVLNFGHTFGHVLESVSRFKLSHGDAVGLGMLCALDVGRALGITPEDVAWKVEDALHQGAGSAGPERTAALLEAPRRCGDVTALLSADKKAGQRGRAAHGAAHRHRERRGARRRRGRVARAVAGLDPRSAPMSAAARRPEPPHRPPSSRRPSPSRTRSGRWCWRT